MTKFYVNSDRSGKALPDEFYQKISHLVRDGAELLESTPERWVEGLVCVEVGGSFILSTYAYDRNELQRLIDHSSSEKVWLIYEPAGDVSGYFAMLKDKTDNYGK